MAIVKIGRVPEGTGPCTASLVGSHVLVHVVGSSASDALSKLSKSVPESWVDGVNQIREQYGIGWGPITLGQLYHGVAVVC